MKVSLGRLLPAVVSVFLLTPPAALWASVSHSDAWQTIENNIRLSASDGSDFKIEPDKLDLKKGQILAAPVGGHVLIATPLAVLEPRRDALVYYRVREGCEHVFVMLGSAALRIGQHRALLNAGDEAVVTDHEPTYKDLVGEDEVGRRRVRMVKLAENRVCVTSEYSLVHLIEREPLAYRIVHSNDAYDHALKERLIKMAAVLNIVTFKHGQYTTGAR